MRGSPRAALGHSEYGTDRSVSWNRVGRRTDRENRVRPVTACPERAAKVIMGRAWVLHRVKAVGTVLPNVQLGILNRPAVNVEHAAVHPKWHAAGALGDAFAESSRGRPRCPERSLHRGLRRSRMTVVGERIDSH